VMALCQVVHHVQSVSINCCGMHLNSQYYQFAWMCNFVLFVYSGDDGCQTVDRDGSRGILCVWLNYLFM
jgi:hypothetical protein